MVDQPVPESRTYRHVQCGDDTTVGDEAFKTVSNPMSSMEQTFCSNCESMFPISNFEWADTNEKLSDYYGRHTKSATDTQRFLCSKKFMASLIVLFALLAGAGFYAIVADEELLTRAICVCTGLVIGAVVGMNVFLKVFENPITRKVCGVSDTRLLT